MNRVHIGWLTALLLLLAPVACDSGDDDGAEDVDSDGDGLSDADEDAFGTDPAVPDTDGDGLGDAEEFEHGCSGTEADGDGDTYLDVWEVAEGTDCADPESRIYTGYWPYNPDKDAIEGETLGGMSRCDVGEVMGRFTGRDQFDDEVDLYDFAYQGRYVIVDVSAVWCTYCQEMAKYLGGQPSYFDSYDDELSPLRDGVDSGAISWVTILSQNASGGAVTQQDMVDWDEDYPHEMIPVLADVDELMPTHVYLVGFPTLVLLDETMTLVSADPENYFNVILDAIDLAGL